MAVKNIMIVGVGGQGTLAHEPNSRRSDDRRRL